MLNRRTFMAALCFLVCAWPLSSLSKTTTGPEVLVKRNYKKIQGIVAKAPDTKVLSDKVTVVLDSMVDWPIFSRKTLTGKIWDALKDPDQKRFIASYRKLIVRKYAKRFKPKTSFTVDFRGTSFVEGKKKAVVKTTVHTQSKGKKLGVDVDYEFVLTKKGWRTGDIITDDISRARTYRPTFRRIYQKRGLDALIVAIEKNAKKR